VSGCVTIDNDNRKPLGVSSRSSSFSRCDLSLHQRCHLRRWPSVTCSVWLSSRRRRRRRRGRSNVSDVADGGEFDNGSEHHHETRHLRPTLYVITVIYKSVNAKKHQQIPLRITFSVVSQAHCERRANVREDYRPTRWVCHHG